MRTKRIRGAVALTAAAVVAVATAGCASERGEDGGGDENKPFIFAGAGDPESLDPSLSTDGETFRVTRQVLETLLTHEVGGTEIVGGLAETWEQSEDGTVWTFHLREGVKFHDGEALTAEVVCANFDRWFNWEGTYQSSNFSAYWQDTFGGFAANENEQTPAPNYKSCTAQDELTPVIEVNEYSAKLPGGFTLASMGIHSPKSLEAYAAAEPPAEGDSLTYPTYSQEVGTVAGTGPFKYAEWNKGNREVTLERNDEYWGEKAGVKTVIVRTISDENARKQALEAGDIHGYDLVAPQDVQPLLDAGFQVPTRGVFNLMYLGITQEQNPALEKLEVRQALAHALDRQKIVDTILPEGGTVATQFLAPTLDGWAEDVPTYDYNADTAKGLLADAGEEDLTIDFCYPTEVTRPYMPAPKDIFESLKADLEAVGITVNAKAMKWSPDYLTAVDASECGIYLLGWTGDYNEAYNFMGTWFANYQGAWGFENEEIFDALAEVNTEPDPATRVEMYKEINALIMEYVPGVPISHSPPSIAFSPDVNPPTTSALTQEQFAEISWK
ncbi:peptide/nickel transport system substrate-binding protein [Stackebrandtia albiflava]|uniref:Peptide/nickel transport system substrate-binding protein n=1 Tax=Stackebrandtia albiflava TaxID=406432 RepID=A0A562V295_9ACTN|nr:ABC transporter substrate-binding protein [Stackebrandtia albiflava]TWJ12019.1 peptide/nickel transport system substrate-binding protein [Stackebrandtia albiflava]